VDLVCFIIPFFFSFFNAFKFTNYWKSFIAASIIVAIPFLIWDSIFTKLSVWWFSHEYTLSIRFFHLPLEEFLFFLAIPYACLFSYHVIKKYVSKLWSDLFIKKLTIGFLMVLIIIALFHHDRDYTFYTCFFLSLFLLFLVIKREFTILYYLKIMFIFILPMMIISDGILTGSFIVKSPIVNYHPMHHMGLRVFNIPIEDFFYGYLLLGLNVFFFEKFNKLFYQKISAIEPLDIYR
jgi:lycopene cyclase domain-containing protein